MITLEKNKLNVVVGPVSSGKTTIMLNQACELVKIGYNVLFVSNDMSAISLSRFFHCLYNDISFTEIKYDKDMVPTGLVLPPNIQFVEQCEVLSDFIMTHHEMNRTGRYDYIFIDSVNYFTDDRDKPYLTKLKNNISFLNSFVGEKEVTITASVNILDISDIKHLELLPDNIGNVIVTKKNKNTDKSNELIITDKDAGRTILTISFDNGQLINETIVQDYPMD